MRCRRCHCLAGPHPHPAADVGHADADSHLRVNRRIVRNTAWVSYLGLCPITMPVGRDRAGMPIGVQLTAPAHAEEKLRTVALAAERCSARGGPARNAAAARFINRCYLFGAARVIAG